MDGHTLSNFHNFLKTRGLSRSQCAHQFRREATMALVAQHAYRGAWRVAESLVTWYIKRKDLERGVLPALTAERFGRSKPPGTSSSLGTISCANRYFMTDFTFSCVAEWQQRTDGEYFTLWIHGASVGETLSALPLIELVLSDAFLRSASGYRGSKKKTKARVLLSTTTPAARKLLSERLSVVRSALLHDEAHICRKSNLYVMYGTMRLRRRTRATRCVFSHHWTIPSGSIVSSRRGNQSASLHANACV